MYSVGAKTPPVRSLFVQKKLWFSYSEDFFARFAEGDTTMWFSYSEDFV
jgi:hypothetical protein